MGFEPAGDGGPMDGDAVLIEKASDGANAFPFAAQFPDDFRVIIELGAARIDVHAPGALQHIVWRRHDS